MPDDAELTFSFPNRRKVYVEVPDIRVPFREVRLGGSPGPQGSVPNEPIRLYDTSGPGSDPEVGLPALRKGWILDRGDVERYDGRPVERRDDGRVATRRAGSAVPGKGPEEAEAASRGGDRRPARALRSSGTSRIGVTQLHYARRGQITAEMRFAALREAVDPEVVRAELAAGRAILPANVNHPESEPMVIGKRFLVKVPTSATRRSPHRWPTRSKS